jgi:hypothetical protein
MVLCEPDIGAVGERLLRPQFGLHRLEWSDDPEGPCVEFHLPHGDLLRLLRGNGFAVDDLIEVQAPEDATTRFEYVTPGWAHRWPSEEVWLATKTG